MTSIAEWAYLPTEKKYLKGKQNMDSFIIIYTWKKNIM